MIQLGGRFCIIFSLSIVSNETSKADRNVFNETYSRVRVGRHLSDILNNQLNAHSFETIL